MASPAVSPEDITYVTARCHCSANKFKIPFLTSKLPLSVDYCHCNTCHHVSGAPALCAPMHGVPLAVDEENKAADLSNLSKFSTSEQLNRYFCSKCGAYMLYETLKSASAPNDGYWSVSVGSLERSEGVIGVGYHQYLGDTLDGGLADFYLRTTEGEEGNLIPRYEGGEGEGTVEVGWVADALRAKREAQTEEESLPAHCQCGRVSLLIKRETEKPKSAAEFWHIPGEKEGDKIRFLAGFCACNDCRLASGALFNPFMFTVRKNILDRKTGRAVRLAFDPEEEGEGVKGSGSLKHYESSPGTFRDFCGTCGASVFYYTKGRQGGELVDIMVGLVDEHVDGRRAERDWLKWWPSVSHAGSAVNKDALGILQRGLKERLN